MQHDEDIAHENSASKAFNKSLNEVSSRETPPATDQPCSRRDVLLSASLIDLTVQARKRGNIKLYNRLMSQCARFGELDRVITVAIPLQC